MLSFFDRLDCFGGPRPNDSILLLYLVDMLAATSHFKPLPSIRITFTKDTIRPTTGIEARLSQRAAKAQLPEYTTNPVPNCPIVQYQSPSVHFPEFQSPTVDPVSTVLVDRE